MIGKKETKTSNKRLGEIELLRFFAAIMIVAYHAHKQLFGDPSFDSFRFSFFCHGYIAVEFFFVLSGVFIGKKLFDLKDSVPIEPGRETVAYTIHKAKSFFPEAIIATIINIIIVIKINRMAGTDAIRYAMDSVWNVLLIKDLGFKSESPNGILWYLTVLLVGSAILYFFGRKHYDSFVRVIAPVGALIILGCIDYNTGMLSGVHQWGGIAYKCMWRGLAEMAIGCTLYEYIQVMRGKNYSAGKRCIMTAVQLICMIAIALYSCLNLTREYEFHSLFAIIVVIVIVMSEKSYFSGAFSNPAICFLGQMSLAMYVNQMFCIRLAQFYVGEANLFLYYVIVLLLDIASAAFTMLLMKKIRSAINV